MKYKYIINITYENYGHKIPITKKAKTLEGAYNYLCGWYQETNPQINFYEKYPLDKVKSEIKEYGYSDFMNNDDIQTVDFYINDYLVGID